MTSVTVLAGSLTTWLGVVGQWAGVFATTSVTYIIYRWQRQHDETERRDREKTQAALVVIELECFIKNNGDYVIEENGTMWLVITNRSEQQVRWLKVETIITPYSYVHFGQIIDGEWEEDSAQLPVLPPHESARMPFRNFRGGGPVDFSPLLFMADGFNRYIPSLNDVVISFNMFGARWWRVGNGDPVRVEAAYQQ